MNITNQLSDSAVLKIVGERIARYRLNRNLTQETLAADAGVSRPTLQRIERGHSTQVTNFIRVLRALDLLENVSALVPAPAESPIQKIKMRGKVRQRASEVANRQSPSSTWRWGDGE